MPEVSAIIPTCGRPQLLGRALASVLSQRDAEVEALVVVDGRDDGSVSAVIAALGDSRVRMLETGRRSGPARARNLGVEQAQGRYIALLDDDDEWLSGKLTRQLELVRQRGLDRGDFIVSSRIVERVVRGGHESYYLRPSRLYEPGGDFSGYLMDRPSLAGRPGMVASGTLLMPRSLAVRAPFPDDTVHEDWTWLLRCVVRDRVPLLMCEQPLFIYHLDLDAQSRSRRLNWRESLAWAQRNRDLLSPRAMAGFIASTVAIRARRHSGLPAFFELAAVMRRDCKAAALHWIMLAGAFALPPGLAEAWRGKTFVNG